MNRSSDSGTEIPTDDSDDASSRRTSAGAGEEIRIVIVDDHPAIREVLASKIRDLNGMQVVGGSGSAQEALSLIDEWAPDVAVVDISLGGIDGLTLTRHIRSEAPGTRVLIFSMYNESVYAERAIQAGASGYLPKREPVEEVLRAIRAVSEGQVHLRQNVLSEILDKVIRKKEDPDESGLQALSHREMTVFQMLGDGDTVAQIADHLDLSRKTVETHRRQAKEKLGCESVRELLRYAVLWTSAGEQV